MHSPSTKNGVLPFSQQSMTSASFRSSASDWASHLFLECWTIWLRYGSPSPGHGDWFMNGHVTQQSQWDIKTVSRILGFLFLSLFSSFFFSLLRLQDTNYINCESPKATMVENFCQHFILQMNEMRERLKPVLMWLFEQLHEAPPQAGMPLD